MSDMSRVQLDSAPEMKSISYEKISGLNTLAALVVGSTCGTGTAGPDIHSVYVLENRKLKELPRDDHHGKWNGVDYFKRLEGNKNFEFTVADGLLQEIWYGKWGPDTVTLTFNWNGKKFVLIDAKFKNGSRQK
ncbi:MAG: hypothetical protein NDI61_12460 [Bdellovibrionaceae bacterium]|nr:hypothetical protein [Pseudobdellovibrionaceae bacterium]